MIPPLGEHFPERRSVSVLLGARSVLLEAHVSTVRSSIETAIRMNEMTRQSLKDSPRAWDHAGRTAAYLYQALGALDEAVRLAKAAAAEASL
ncbi:MAG: hypothetical protein ACRD3Y_02265 [Bryobacteraceae bacterium]